MKRNISLIAAVLSCAIAGACFFRIGMLENEINELKWHLDNRMQEVQNEIYGITGDIEYTLEQQASLLSDSGYDWGQWKNIDVLNNSATFHCYVVPKEYNPETTKATIRCGENMFPMTLENSRFVADVTIPIFEESRIDCVQFEENGIIRTEKLDWYMYPRSEILPDIFVESPGYRLDYKDDKAVLTFDGYMGLHIEHRGNDYEKYAEIAVTVDGKEKWRTGIDLSQPAHSNSYYAMYDLQLSKSLDVEYGKEVKIYFEIKDGYGLLHRCLAETITFDEKQGTSHSVAMGEGADIFAPDGTPLYINDIY